jgi:hypothetical protein
MSIENPFDGAPTPPKPERELRPDELREKMRDPNFLPTHEDIYRAFESEGYRLEEWINLCYNEENPVFEFLNEEFITAFSNYLAQRVESLGASEDSPITILEVGAGNGRLSHFLQQKLESILPGKVKIVATDSGEWSLKTAFPVETISHKEALEKHKPKIVVFSWMPLQEDVTDDFRAGESVEEYILIGETDGGCCGDEWRTWGQSWSFDEEEEGKEKVAPYIADGFERENIYDVSDHQICRTDKPGNYYHSRTTSFRRKR